jgi:hypothetical protein
MRPEEREARRVAYLAVGRALRNKVLVRQPCEVCGDKFSHAHHRWGYAEPLRVVWLCATHHVLEHQQMSYDRPRGIYHEPRHWQYSEGTGPGEVYNHLDRLFGLLTTSERRRALRKLAQMIEEAS